VRLGAHGYRDASGPRASERCDEVVSVKHPYTVDRINLCYAPVFHSIYHLYGPILGDRYCRVRRAE
jgi:hypothetical protein